MDNFLKVGRHIASAASTVNGWVAAAIMYLTPLHGIFWIVFILIVADFISGLAASAKRKIPRSSKRLRKSISKALCYFGTIYILWEIESKIGVEEWICTYKIIAAHISITEFVSVLENMAIITENPIFIKLIKIIRGKAAQSEKTGSLIEDIIEEKNGKTDIK